MAYKTLSMKYHPDKHKDDAVYQKKMKDINEAKSVLLDKEKRKEYDVSLKKEKERKEIIVAPETTNTYKDKQTKHSSDKKQIIIAMLSFLVLVVVVFSIIFLVKNPQSKSINIGMTTSQVIKKFGTPNSQDEKTLKYEQSTILVYNGVVVGWIDTYSDLNIKKYKNAPQEKDITPGMLVNNIINKYGNPDTYSDKIIAYKTLLIYTNQGVVEKVISM